MSLEAGDDPGVPVWAAFGDLMAVLLGVFVLLLLGVAGMHLHALGELDAAKAERAREVAERTALEDALAVPLAAGRVSLVDGRIGIRGNVLFALNSDALQDDGRRLLHELAGPLAAYLAARDQVLMVSGFTDDRPVRETNRRYADNWELSAQRALTVTRVLVEEGVPSDAVFAAAFGDGQPVAPNTDAEGRARNRRVEIAPMPRPRQAKGPGRD
jgi:flagellar motor protein MotB